MKSRKELRKKINEVKERLREERPHDGFTVSYGLPKGPFTIVASRPMRQTTLDEFMELSEQPLTMLPDKVYDFHITIHPSQLSSGELDRTIDSILTTMKTNYPSHKE